MTYAARLELHAGSHETPDDAPEATAAAAAAPAAAAAAARADTKTI